MKHYKQNITAMVTGMAIGASLVGGAAAGIVAEPTWQNIYVDGQQASMTAYNIAGNNYVRLRDIGQQVGFNVYWSDGVQIDTDAPYTGMEIQLPTPENSKIVDYPAAATLSGGVLRQTVNVPAKDEYVLTYTVKPIGRPGDVIFNHGGFVHALPLPEIKTAIQTAAPNAAAVSDAADANKDKSDDNGRGHIRFPEKEAPYRRYQKR